MRRLIFCTGIILLSCFLFGWMSFTKPLKNNAITFATTVYADSAEKNYQNFCGGCHGEKMDAFVDRQWKHGSSKADMFKGIKFGYANEGMPAFDSAFSDKAINELADYIVKGVENVKKYNFQNNIVIKENYFPSAGMAVKLDTVVKNIKVPWGIAFLPGGDLLVTDRNGKLYRKSAQHSLDSIAGVPEVLAEGQGGLLDIVLHPQFAKNRFIYLSYSAPKKTDSGIVATTAIMRAVLEGNRLTGQKVIFEALPYSKTRHHYGSRMVFGRDGKLYFSVGERGNEKENPQTIKNDLGKIHRINDDGTIPADNPFVHTAGAKGSIYSYGQRNPQGLIVYPPTGAIWETEHGPRGGDELNHIKKGANYGWPVVTFGINYNGKIISKNSLQPGIEPPLNYWIPSIGPSGLAFVEGNRYPQWKGNLMVGSLRFKYLARCRLQGNKVVQQEMLLKNIGRLRDVRMGPDGYIYIAVENPGYVFRLVPVAKRKS